MRRNFPAMIIITAVLMLTPAAAADEIKVAVAANFADAMTALVSRFETDAGHTVVPVFGSTGKLYAQIVNGAPFALFLAADVERPKLLEEQGRAVAGSRWTYAVGRLILWSGSEDCVDPKGEVLRQGTFRHLAIANPELAPYGQAAREALRAMGLWERLEPRLVRGESIVQAFQFVHTGNAELGFVALSLLRRPGISETGSSWLVPPGLHRPIEQQVVLLEDSKTARAFLEFLRGNDARKIIRSYGYSTP